VPNDPAAGLKGARESEVRERAEPESSAVVRNRVCAAGVMRVARPIADLEGSTGIASAHIAEAIQYRRLDAGF